MSFNGQISGSLAPQGAKTGSVSGRIGAVTPAIRDGAVTTAKLADEAVTTPKLADEAVTTAKIADAAVTIAKLAQDVTALINSKGDASDVATLQSDVAALQTITAGFGTASTYGVANNLTQAAAGVNVLDAAQGKVLGDRLSSIENVSTYTASYSISVGSTYSLSAMSVGRIAVVSGYFNPTSDVAANTYIATITGLTLVDSVYTSSVSSSGNGVRMVIRTNGKIQIERAANAYEWVSFSFVGITAG